MVRTLAQLQRVVDGNPFVRRGEDAKHCHALFCEKAATGAVRSLDLDAYAPEEAAAVGTELYLFLPGGVGRSKLATNIAKNKGAAGTMRSWRTVTKLLELADAL
jgi:uncharacterized protein (DUF1697 family)